jgi:hypothetical protein
MKIGFTDSAQNARRRPVYLAREQYLNNNIPDVIVEKNVINAKQGEKHWPYPIFNPSSCPS